MSFRYGVLVGYFMGKSIDIWKDIFLKNILFENIILNDCNIKFEVLNDENNQKKNTYQFFEILICTTLSKFYPDFCWHLTPVSKDRGIDVWALKDDRNLPFQTKRKPIVIYGQIKRNASYFGKQKIIEATNKIISAHTDLFLQKRNVYKIIHLISSDKSINQEITPTLGLVNSLPYIIEVINAEDIFTIWALNKNLFLSSLPVVINETEKNQINLFLEQRSKKLSDIICYKLETPDSIPLGAPVKFRLIISNLLQVPFTIDVGIHIVDAKIFLIAPQNIIKNSIQGVNITLYNEYSMDIFIKVIGEINTNTTYITLSYGNENEIINIDIPIENITSRNDPIIYMDPIAKPYNTLCNALSNEEGEKVAFYSIVGEGGIGKSTLTKEISIWAINHDYCVYEIEHPCQETVEYKLMISIFEKLIFENASCVHIYPQYNDKLKRKLAHYYNSTWNKTMDTFFREGKIINSEHFYECLITLFIYVLERHPILITLSNLHWGNAKLMDFFNKIIHNLQLNQMYFIHKIIIIFEGRIFEAVKDKYSLKIANEWLTFYDRDPVIPIKMGKWSDECSLKYIETLFKNDNLDPLTSKARENIISFIFANCKGNPMHIKEAIITLENHESIKSIAYNSYLPVRNNYNEIYISTLIDTIKLRIVYYMKQWAFLMDMLVILSCLERGAFVYQFIENEYYNTGSDDWKNVLRDSGFIILNINNISFLHENYKISFYELKVLCDENVDRFLLWCKSENYNISLIEKAKLELKKKEVSYLNVYNKVIQGLKVIQNHREQYQLLQLINDIYEYLPINQVMPRYYLYKQLETVTKEMGSWKTALKYIQKLKNENLETVDYMIVCSHGRRNLANIYSFNMQWDEAINEASKAIIKLERFMQNKSFKPAEFFELERQRSLLYNRLSIVYHFSGNHSDAHKQDKSAYQISKRTNDIYAMYHIQYERGIWKLNCNSTSGYKLINEAQKCLLDMDAVTQQEKDLVSTYEKMAYLKKTTKRKKLSRSFLQRELDKCIELSKRNSMQNESLEPIVCNTLCGVINVFLNDYLEAIDYFERSLTIAGRASMEQCLWMCYLNVAQAYALLAMHDSEWAKIYTDKKLYYAEEAHKLIMEAIKININSNHLEKVYSYPQKIITLLKNPEHKQIDITSEDEIYSPVYIEYQNFAFFLL